MRVRAGSISLPVSSDALPNFSKRRCPIRKSKGLPCQTDRKENELRKEPAARNEVSGTVQLEQKQLARRKRCKGRMSRGFPKVDLFDALPPSMEAPPVVICHPNKKSHGCCESSPDAQGHHPRLAARYTPFSSSESVVSRADAILPKVRNPGSRVPRSKSEMWTSWTPECSARSICRQFRARRSFLIRSPVAAQMSFAIRSWSD